VIPLWVIVVGAMALAVGFSVTAILRSADALPTEIIAALMSVEEPDPSGSFITIVDGAPTGVARGIQFGLFALVLGCVPAASLGAFLRWYSRRTSWPRAWENAFLAGLVFQLSSLVFTAFLLVLLVWAAYDSGAQAEEVVWPVGLLFVGVLCGVWGVGSWRFLELQVPQAGSTIGINRPANTPLQPTSGADARR
jgi:hypothetical protein